MAAWAGVLARHTHASCGMPSGAGDDHTVPARPDPRYTLGIRVGAAAGGLLAEGASGYWHPTLGAAVAVADVAIPGMLAIILVIAILRVAQRPAGGPFGCCAGSLAASSPCTPFNHRKLRINAFGPNRHRRSVNQFDENLIPGAR
jgi:hypothetical protein